MKIRIICFSPSSDVFRGLFRRAGVSNKLSPEHLPTIHCHCFSGDLTHPESDVKKVLTSQINALFFSFSFISTHIPFLSREQRKPSRPPSLARCHFTEFAVCRPARTCFASPFASPTTLPFTKGSFCFFCFFLCFYFLSSQLSSLPCWWPDPSVIRFMWLLLLMQRKTTPGPVRVRVIGGMART